MTSVSTLNLQACPKLKLFAASSCKNLLVLKLAGLMHLEKVDLSCSSLISLDISGCTALNFLFCNDSIALTSVLLSDCCRLKMLIANNCPALVCLDLTNCANLKILHCKENSVESLDLSACVSLTELKCSGSKIRSLDVSPAAATLVKLCSDRCVLLEVLCATGCNKLDTLWCGYCPLLQKLSLQGCSSLARLWCKGSGKYHGVNMKLLHALETNVDIQKKRLHRKACTVVSFALRTLCFQPADTVKPSIVDDCRGSFVARALC